MAAPKLYEEMTWQDVKDAAEAQKPVVIAVGSTVRRPNWHLVCT